MGFHPESQGTKPFTRAPSTNLAMKHHKPNDFPARQEKAPQSNGLQGLKVEPANGLEPLTY